MDRFFLSPEEWDDTPALIGEEAHHCCRVMRKEAGNHIVVFDGCGREGEAKITRVSKSEVGLEFRSTKNGNALKPQIEIAVGVPKGKTFDLILQKAVEMGVSRIQPLMSAQGNVRFKESEAESKREKWQRIVLEACKQCGQNFLPEVAVPLALEGYLQGLRPGSSRFVGALTEEARSFRSSLEGIRSPEEIILMIGPEGDFSASEYERISEVDFVPVDLGELVLRTETAVFAMVSAVRYQFQS